MISTRSVELVIDTVGAVAKADPIRRPCTIETACEWATARVRARRLRRPISSGLRLRRLGRVGFLCWGDRAGPPGPIHAKLSLLRERPRHGRDGRHRGFVHARATQDADRAPAITP